jgi:hypothetical protein
VASVLIEKPARGDFLPILDGGFSLQYSPLLEQRDGSGLILFCQLDVTGRTETDPIAERLLHNLLEYVSRWQPLPRRTALYIGEPAGKEHLQSTGIAVSSYNGGPLSTDQVLIVGPQSQPSVAANVEAINDWLGRGGYLLAIGLDEREVGALPLTDIRLRRGEHIATFFEPRGASSLLRGIGPADVYNRDPHSLPLVIAGVDVLGNGVLAEMSDGHVVFCQLSPWRFGSSQQPNLRKTFRRSSYTVARILANMGVAASSPITARFHQPVEAASSKRWQHGLYVDQPQEWDDPYRFFRW